MKIKQATKPSLVIDMILRVERYWVVRIFITVIDRVPDFNVEEG